MITTDSNFM